MEKKYSVDELLLRTVGVLETIPSRIDRLENIVRELERDFSEHIGESSSVEEKIRRIKEFDEKLEEFKKEISELKNQITPAIEAQKSLQKTKETIWMYISDCVQWFFRYTMLPVTIFILIIVVGVDTEWIPWETRTQQITHDFEDNVDIILQNITNNEISISKIKFLLDSPPKYTHIIKSNNSDYINSKIRRVNENSIFIWLPDNIDQGELFIINRYGRISSGPILIRK